MTIGAMPTVFYTDIGDTEYMLDCADALAVKPSATTKATMRVMGVLPEGTGRARGVIVTDAVAECAIVGLDFRRDFETAPANPALDGSHCH